MAVLENELVRQAVGGERTALTQLFGRHAPTVRQAVARQIPRRWRSLLSENDVMQQTYADAFRGIGQFEATEESSFAAWLTILARCNLQDAIRMLEAEKRGGDRRRLDLAGGDGSFVALCELLSSSGSTPSGHFARVEAHSALEQAIEHLPKTYRQVVRMYDLESQAAQEVGAALERSPGAVYMLRARAHDRLREILGRASKFFTIGVSVLAALRLCP